MKITYKAAKKEDAELLVRIYNSAFYDDYIRYGECPAYGRSIERMTLSIQQFPKFIISCDETPVGVISYENKGGGHYYLGCLCIIPEYQGKGIGTKAFKYMQSLWTDWTQITLVTPADKEENIRFYTQKCGFSIGDKVLDGNVEVVNFYLKR